ncbi:MAG: HAD family phosphatase [Proteobacteria bacterium]|nr:HAD family phosphatase [Pseudomonadota bacterium]
MTFHAPCAAIFDLDGTLVDSFDAHWRSWHAMCARHGVNLPRELFVRSFGMRNDRIIDLYWHADEKEALYREMVAHDFPAMTGGRDLLMRLHDAGWMLAVGTSGPPENLRVAVDGLDAGRFFHTEVCGRDVEHGKPAPDIFLKAAERMGIPPGRCVVVEDAVPGIQAAHAAGMPCIAICSEGHTHEELSSAERVIDRFEDLTVEAMRALLGVNSRKL